MSEQELEATPEWQEPELPLPGAALRAAREAAGLSVSEVSLALKFGARQIDALENDDYSILTGTTFIRGFVRSYARYLRLDETPLLAALEPQAPVQVQEVRTVESMDAEMPQGSGDGSRRAYWLAGGVLALGAVAWFAWQGNAPATSTEQEPGSAATTTEQAVQATAEAGASALAPTPVTLDEVAKPAESSATPSPVVAPVPAPVTQVPVVSPAPTVAAPVVAPLAPGATAAPASVSEAAAPVANPNERQLALNFNGVSWIEIRDASQRVIFSGRSTPDSRQVLRGRPPFQLVIGNAQAVKLRYEDRSIDLQPYTRVDVARLTLDDNTK